ncbi:MAG: acyl-CoA dehydrogenase, partial [Actinobacteria bacterium]|nr:acyl-CoA dehydrogenase [Actinomycetota bacterium]
MDVRLDDSLNDFRDEVRTWLEEHLSGEFGAYRGKGLTGHEDIPADVQIAWEKELATGGWLGIDFPASIGGRECTLAEQVVFHLTYVEAKAPGRIPNMGVTLLGPTLMAFGSEAQQQRFVPKILSGDELWCQGYSEPDAGSDLSNVKTRADLVDGKWVVNGQKVWTSLAQFADWIFVVARTEPGSERHAGLSYLLMPMDQPGIEIRPIVQITGGTEFNETFFSDAVCDEDMVVGGVGNGWKVAMGTLAFERGASTLGQQVSFRQEFEDLLALAKANGRWDDPVVRQELTEAHIRLEILKY